MSDNNSNTNAVTTDLAAHKTGNDLSLLTRATLFVQSGMFPDVTKISAAAVQIMAGQELGIGPFAALRGISIIKGRANIGADIIASKLRESEKYDYRVDEMTAERCVITVFHKNQEGNWTECPPYTFTMAMADNAGLTRPRGSQPSLYKAYPARMLFTVAIAHAQRCYAPDVLAFTAYTEGEAPAFYDAPPATLAPGKHFKRKADRAEIPAIPEKTTAEVVDIPTPPPARKMPSQAIAEMVAPPPEPVAKVDAPPVETVEDETATMPMSLVDFLDKKRVRTEYLKTFVIEENRDEILSWKDTRPDALGALIKHYEAKVGPWPFDAAKPVEKPVEHVQAVAATFTPPVETPAAKIEETVETETPAAALPFDPDADDDGNWAD